MPAHQVYRLVLPTFLTLLLGSAYAQSPDERLSTLSPGHQAWVNRACPKSFPPSLWTSCVAREAAALSRGVPDLTGLSVEHQAWVLSSCPNSFPPSLAISCRTREKAALSRGVPDLSGLNHEDRAWVLRSCPGSFPPTLAVSCRARELAALKRGVPSLAHLPADRQAMVQQSCPRSLPPSVYGPCLTREATAGSDVQRVPKVSPPAVGATPTPPRARRATPSRRSDRYEIEVSHNDELFIINGEKFEAQSYCFDMEEGDQVIFLEGSPFGACASAAILNLRTRQTCNVWCE